MAQQSFLAAYIQKFSDEQSIEKEFLERFLVTSFKMIVLQGETLPAHALAAVQGPAPAKKKAVSRRKTMDPRDLPSKDETCVFTLLKGPNKGYMCDKPGYAKIQGEVRCYAHFKRDAPPLDDSVQVVAEKPKKAPKIANMARKTAELRRIQRKDLIASEDETGEEADSREPSPEPPKQKRKVFIPVVQGETDTGLPGALPPPPAFALAQEEEEVVAPPSQFVPQAEEEEEYDEDGMPIKESTIGTKEWNKNYDDAQSDDEDEDPDEDTSRMAQQLMAEL